MENVHTGSVLTSQMNTGEMVSVSKKMAEYEKSLATLSDHVERLNTTLATCQKTCKETALALNKLQTSHNSLAHYTEILKSFCLELDTKLTS